MSEWKEYRLGDIVNITDYVANGSFAALKANVTYREQKDHAILVRLYDYHNDWNGPFVYVDEKSYNFLKKSSVEPGDLVIANVGANAGKCFLAPDLKVKMTLGPNSILIKGEKSKYLYYYFNTSVGKWQLDSIITGSAQPKFNKTDLRNLIVSLPDNDTQGAIAEILSSIDDKIELNNQISKNLEALAQALFKQWFVDFEFPNENGQPYKSSGGEMVESELGMIPKGWELKKLSELINITGGGTPKRANSEFWDGNIPWFSVQDVPAESQIVVVNTKEKITELGLNNSSTRILPVGTTIITARGTVGKLALVAEPMAMNQSCYGINGKDGIGTYFNYYNLKLAVTALQQNTHGAVFDTITTGTFDTVKVSFGNIDLTKEFDKVVKDWFSLIESNVKENQYLSSLRDSLLPKLISGELELL